MTAQSPIREIDKWFTGEDQIFEWAIMDASGTPVTTTGWVTQFRMSVVAGGASVLTLAGSVSGTTRLRATVAAADTTNLAAIKYFYTLSRTDAGFNQVLAYGDAFLNARVL